jgi:DNA replicative helicase MCM subunit Mcm2 (Cdc46/Mcm family)
MASLSICLIDINNYKTALETILNSDEEPCEEIFQDITKKKEMANLAFLATSDNTITTQIKQLENRYENINTHCKLACELLNIQLHLTYKDYNTAYSTNELQENINQLKSFQTLIIRQTELSRDSLHTSALRL